MCKWFGESCGENDWKLIDGCLEAKKRGNMEELKWYEERREKEEETMGGGRVGS